MDLGTINNRVYLGHYKDIQQFWADVGLVFQNCRRYNRDAESDIRRLADTLREVIMTINRSVQSYCTNSGMKRQLKSTFK